MKTRRRSVMPEERAIRNASLLERLQSVLEALQPGNICLYHPSDGEPDLRSLMQSVPSAKFFFPAVNGDLMEFFRVLPGEGFVPGVFGILEPADRSEPLSNVTGLTVICAPGVVFDRRGGRIGRGRGYYDRYLAVSVKSAVKIGTAWGFQIVEEILPLKPTDVKMDLLVTDESVVRM